MSKFFQLLIGFGLVWFGFELDLGFTKFYTHPKYRYIMSYFVCLIYEPPNDSKVHPMCHVEKINTLFTYQLFFFGIFFPILLTKIMGKLVEFLLNFFLGINFAKFLQKTVKFLFHKIGREKRNPAAYRIGP